MGVKVCHYLVATGLPIPRIAPSPSRQGGQDASRRSLQLALPAIRPAENSSCKVFFRQGRLSRANAALPTLTSAMMRSGQYKSCFQAKTRALFSKSPATLMSVSYTHLTLPTIYSV